MKNGIYLFVVLFLGIMGYFVVSDLMAEQSVMLASIVFLLFSVAITSLITHYKKRKEASPMEKILNIVYVGMFAIYGLLVGFSLIYSPSMEVSTVGFEGGLFVVASLALVYGIYKFVSTKMLMHY